jgi:two-component system, OmpR family, sensor histidine kinase BaeS
VRVLAAIVPLMAIGLVVVSVRRMALYDDAFGMTMLRLWVVGAALWMGVVLLMIAVRNAGFGRSRNWLVGGALAAALALVLVVNVLSPEAFIVRHNVQRAEQGHEFDATYLAGLSDDAVPALVDALEHSTNPAVRAQLRATLDCDDARGVTTLNVAARAASEARTRACATR